MKQGVNYDLPPRGYDDYGLPGSVKLNERCESRFRLSTDNIVESATVGVALPAGTHTEFSSFPSPSRAVRKIYLGPSPWFYLLHKQFEACEGTFLKRETLCRTQNQKSLPSAFCIE